MRYRAQLVLADLSETNVAGHTLISVVLVSPGLFLSWRYRCLSAVVKR
jgi:hypothetical protein